MSAEKSTTCSETTACDVRAVCVRCACGVRAVCVRCACGVRAVCVRCACGVCGAWAVCVWCVCSGVCRAGDDLQHKEQLTLSLTLSTPAARRRRRVAAARVGARRVTA
eukprot:scaffold5217_cov75-Phaeocystis_antarctica.AAC.2